MTGARAGWIAAAYAALAVLVSLDAVFGGVHLGALAIIPLLLIGFYGSRWLAVVTALACAAIFAPLDHDVLRPLFMVPWPVPSDAAFLAITFVAILFTAERLRSNQIAARSDSLTAVPNRREIMRTIDIALARAKVARKPLALLFVDLDNFKSVNDRYGHAIGDNVLRYAAERLVHTVRDEDAVGRIGGDEFVVLLDDVENRAQAEHVAENIESALSAPFRTGEGLEIIGATTGIGMFPADGEDCQTLLLVADRDLYQRKAAKRKAAG